MHAVLQPQVGEREPDRQREGQTWRQEKRRRELGLRGRNGAARQLRRGLLGPQDSSEGDSPAFGAVYTVVPGRMAETGLGCAYGSLGEAETRVTWVLPGAESPAMAWSSCTGAGVWGWGRWCWTGALELGCGTSHSGLSSRAQSVGGNVLWECRGTGDARLLPASSRGHDCGAVVLPRLPPGWGGWPDSLWLGAVLPTEVCLAKE